MDDATDDDDEGTGPVPERPDRRATALLQAVEVLGTDSAVEDGVRRILDCALTCLAAHRAVLYVPAGEGVEARIGRIRWEGKESRDFDPDGAECSTGVVAKTWADDAETCLLDAVPSPTLKAMNDRMDAAFYDPLSPNYASVRVNTVLSVPLASRGARRGVLYLDDRAMVRQFSVEDLPWARAMGRVLSAWLGLSEGAGPPPRP